MISDEELEQLRFKGESTDLDFKSKQYPFVRAEDYKKSELLKDILAMANTYRSGPGYILIGFDDKSPDPAEVVGLNPEDSIDDASIQQFVGSKLSTPLEFHYEERKFDGKHIAVISVPKQPRPFAATKDFGVVKRNVVYVRRGSSTGEATMDEIKKMILADAGISRSVQIDLRLDGEDNTPLPERVERAFLEFESLPDYDPPHTMEMGHGLRLPMPRIGLINRHFYREGAEYFSAEGRKIIVRVSLANRSDFSISDAKLELWCSTPAGASVRLLRANELPDEPEPDQFTMVGGLDSLAKQLGERVSVEERGNAPVCHIRLGILLPGESSVAESDIALLPSQPGQYKLHVRILAREIASPVLNEFPLIIGGEVQHLDLDDLERLLYDDATDEDG